MHSLADENEREEVPKLASKRKNSSAELARKMYLYFISYDDRGAPSFGKFARSVGLTVESLEALRRAKKFDKAYRECREIRRDYLIDRALDKRFDPSMVKHLLSIEGEPDALSGDFTLQLEVSE